jgi:putative hydrolase of the HAD superfamily
VTIEAVLFDADGVVVPPLGFARYRWREHGVTPEMTQGFFRGVFLQCLLGKADLKQVLPPFLDEWAWEGTVDEFVATWLEKDDAVDERVVGVVHALRSAGLTCCLATNQERYRAAYMRDAMGFRDLFDYLFFSCELGAEKPDAAFFEAVEASLGLTGGSILFWDDDVRNVDAAVARGWNAEVYVVFQEFVRQLNGYLRGQAGGA